jgi:hypothetical protein
LLQSESQFDLKIFVLLSNKDGQTPRSGVTESMSGPE